MPDAAPVRTNNLPSIPFIFRIICVLASANDVGNGQWPSCSRLSFRVDCFYPHIIHGQGTFDSDRHTEPLKITASKTMTGLHENETGERRGKPSPGGRIGK